MFRVLLSVCLGLVSFTAFAQLAAEPTTAPTNLRKDVYDEPWVFDIRFDGSGANGYLVLRSTEPINTPPVDGVAYTKGQGLGNAKVFSVGASTFIRIEEAGAGVTYHFAIYPYNITSSNSATINYLQSNPLTGTLTSKDNNYGGYYSGIDFGSSDVLLDLKNLINPHTMVSYSSFTSTIVNEFHERDTANNQKVINCQYSNEFVVYSGSFGLGTYGYSREHRMPFSWVNFTNMSRNQFESAPEGCDIHSLELTNNDVNSHRSNIPVGTALSSIWTYFEFTEGKDHRNKDVADVMDSRQGDVARAKFYMMLCYNGKYGENWGLDNLLGDADNQELQKLVDWHFADLPDAFEKARHEYVVSKQGNRNPFIDFPDLVNCIDFSDMTLKADCSQMVGIVQLEQQADFMLFPQPAADLLNISFTSPVAETTTLSVYDLTGKLVMKQNYEVVAGAQNLQLNTAQLVPGYYLFAIDGEELNARGRFTVAR